MFIIEFKKHPLDYLILASGILLILIAFFINWPIAQQQQLWAVVLGVFYTFWGLWHHARTNSLHQDTVLEYVGLGVLATTILLFLIKY